MSAESPFKRKPPGFRKESTFTEIWWEKITSEVDTGFLDSIPSEDVKQLPPRYLYPIGMVIVAILVVIFIAVLVPGYASAVRTRFLSPAGSGDPRYCTDVTISNTGSFLATQYGAWQGSSDFAYSNATYQINLVNVQMDEQQFSASMKDFNAQLAEVGKQATSQDVAVNLLYWMSWVQVGAHLERFSMTGTPLMVFQRQITAGTISNQLHDCNATSEGSFDPSTGTIAVSYDVDSFQSNPSCSGNGNITDYGYSPIANTDKFNLQFDIRALITAVAINLGVVKPRRQLQLVDHTVYNVSQVSYYAASFVDPRYPGMAPVLCLFDKRDTPYCLISVGFMYGLPVFNHIGNNTEYPAKCDCTQEISEGVNKNYTNVCNHFNFLTGVIVWPHAEAFPDPALELMLSMSAQRIYDLAHPPMFTAGAYGTSSPLRGGFNSPSQRQEMYSFCQSDTYGACSIVTFSSYDSTFAASTVSTNYFQVDYGACQDTFTTASDDW
jgi:hypothetical protein